MSNKIEKRVRIVVDILADDKLNLDNIGISEYDNQGWELPEPINFEVIDYISADFIPQENKYTVSYRDEFSVTVKAKDESEAINKVLSGDFEGEWECYGELWPEFFDAYCEDEV